MSYCRKHLEFTSVDTEDNAIIHIQLPLGPVCVRQFCAHSHNGITNKGPGQASEGRRQVAVGRRHLPIPLSLRSPGRLRLTGTVDTITSSLASL